MTHRCTHKSAVFDVSVTRFAACEGTAPDYFFVARIARVAGDRRIAVCGPDGRRDFYGPTEDWALRNARALLDSGLWHENVPQAA